VDKHRVLLLLCCMHAVFGPFKHALQTFDMDGAFVSDARLVKNSYAIVSCFTYRTPLIQSQYQPCTEL
jgi:hypothetical protein